MISKREDERKQKMGSKLEKQRLSDKRKKSASVEGEDMEGMEEAGNKKLKVFTDDLNGVELTSGRTSGSLTSTAVSVSYTKDTREATPEEILQSQFNTMKKMKKKGFVRLNTTLGIMDLELHCDIAPRTCTNFIGLCLAGKYNGTLFHRSIRNFMIQGGKPSKGTEVETSLWGGSFIDEFDDRLKHSSPGIVSMANAGPGTNKRQFFITFKSAAHLDRKHAIFGRVAKGMEILQEMESVPTDKKDRPREEIKIIEATVFVNPVEEAQKKERIRIQKRIQEKEASRVSALHKPSTTMQVPKAKSEVKESFQIGRYLPINTVSKGKKKEREGMELPDLDITSLPQRLPPPPKKTTFGDFSNW